MEIHINTRALALLAKFIMPLAIVVAAVMGARTMLNNPPGVDRRPPAASATLQVRVLDMQPQDYRVRITSYGEVKAKTRTRLTSRLTSEVSFIANELRAGGYFSQGQVLLRLDATDFELDIKSSEAAVAQAEAALSEEQARAEQARNDWQRLGRDLRDAGALALRAPQLMAAEADLANAQAMLERARVDLQRTVIRAPFDGVTIAKFVEVGELVSSGGQLADIHNDDLAQVRLPIAQDLFAFVDSFIGNSNSEVLLIDDIGNQLWTGKLAYAENSIDETTRQVALVAEIANAWSKQPIMRLGQYLQADIKGELLRDVFVIPQSALRSDGKVFVLEDGLLATRAVDLLWEDDDNAVVNNGLARSDQLVLDSLGSILPGTPAQPRGARAPDSSEPPAKDLL